METYRSSSKDEAALIGDLLSGLNDSFFDNVPSPDPSPRKKIQSAPVLAADVDVDTLLEGAEGWDWSDMSPDFMSPKQSRECDTSSMAIHTSESLCTRCTVQAIMERLSICFEKHLTVKTESNECRLVILRDIWVETDIFVGDVINVLGHFITAACATPTIVISSKSNLLILHPDILLTATSISNAPQCLRRPLLSGLVRSVSDTTPSLVWGNMLHVVMQQCFSAQRWDESFLEEGIDEVVRKGLGDLVKIGMSVEQAKSEVKLRAKGLPAFSKKFIAESPRPDSILSETHNAKCVTSFLAITRLYDIEEDIWSSTYGIKGKIDVSVQTIIEERNAIKFSQESRPAPLEIKTGRAVAGMEHRAQTMLYTLLLAERYGTTVSSGFLYYTQSDEVIRVPVRRNEVRGLIMARNEMARYVMRRTKAETPLEWTERDGNIKFPDAEPFLPPTIDEERICSKCYAVDACMLYRKAVEHVFDESSPIADLYALKTSHLTPNHISFFKKWEALISLEEQDLMRFRKELWTMSAREREQKGRCLSSMVIDTSYNTHGPGAVSSKDMKIHQYSYKFVRQASRRHEVKESTHGLLNGHLLIGDPVLVSVEPTLLALARGFVLELYPEQIVVGVDHGLNREYILGRAPQLSSTSPIVFRIDKDELFGGLARVRDNLAQLFYMDGDIRRLELIVDLKAPTFDELRSSEALRFPNVLNANQQQAVAKAVSANDYALILGMPGTGKTTTIAEIIQALVQMGKTVLLTSYTHSAVDTILLKLKDIATFGMLRLGNMDKIHPDIHRFTLNACPPPTTVEQLEQQILKPPVVATTCLSIDHALFSRRKFDYCIVDEASQITLPTCIGPLRFCDKFILVGDHFQLPPLVRSRDARKNGLDVSLFRRLSDAHPHAVVDLVYQYRMNEDIMLLSNKLIYGDRLKCGSVTVAKQTLQLPHRSRVDCCRSDCWLQRLLNESCTAVFVDTDAVPAKDSRVGDLIQNEVEACLAQQVAEAFLKSGVRQEQIGIIALYRQQIKLISHLLQDYKEIETLTTDRSQGRDKDCIIISMVRSNDSGQIGELLKDWRRMNVAFTRARAKLIILGSRKTLQAAPLLAEFFSLMERRGWMLSLPPGADKLHDMRTPGRTIKRPATDSVSATVERSLFTSRPQRVKRAKVEEGLLRSRPVLRDLLNDSKT